MQPNVLACIDDSRYAEAVCDYAAWSAQRIAAPLSLLHVLDDPRGEARKNLSGSIGFGAQEALLQELAELDSKRAKIAMEHGKHMLDAAKARILKTGIENLESRHRHGELISTLKALEDETQMLVVGKRGAETASEHGHIGGHLEQIIRSFKKPVLIAQQFFHPPKKIMLAFDGSNTARKAVEMVAASPLYRDIPCHLVMVGTDSELTREQLESARQRLCLAGFEVTGTIIFGDPEFALTDYQRQENIDLLIMGAYGHSRIRHLIVGSTTTTMIRKTKISLMVLR